MGCDLFFYLIKFNMSIGIKSYANIRMSHKIL